MSKGKDWTVWMANEPIATFYGKEAHRHADEYAEWLRDETVCECCKDSIVVLPAGREPRTRPERRN